MDQLSPNFLPDAGLVPMPGSAPTDHVVVYPIVPSQLNEARGQEGSVISSDSAAAAVPTSATAPPVTSDELMRSELLQAEMAGVLAMIANDFFARQIEPSKAEAAGPVKSRAEPEEISNTAMGFNLCTLAQRHRQEFFLETRENSRAIEPVEAAATVPAPQTEPPADWFVDPELNESIIEETARTVAEAVVVQPEPLVEEIEAKPAVEPPQPWPSNVIAFPIARRIR